MAKQHRVSLVACIVVLAMNAAAQASGWHRDVDAAMQLARAQQRPLVLFVTMDGCTYCHKMVETTLSDQGILRVIGTQFVPAAIKATDRPDLMRKLKIRSFPTTLLVSPRGEIVDQITGYIDVRKFDDRLRRAHAYSIGTASKPAPVVRK